MSLTIAEEAGVYADQLADNESALDYLVGVRGLRPEVIKHYQLGYIAKPVSPEAQWYQGRLTIPYFGVGKNGRNTYHLRTRTLSGPKEYKWWPKDSWPLKAPKVHIYNASSLLDAYRVVITEGEIDALTLVQLGIDAIGIPGVNSFEPAWSYLLEGKDVMIAFDGDQPGREAAKTLKDILDDYKVHARLVHLPDGKDINEVYMQFGEDKLQEVLGW